MVPKNSRSSGVRSSHRHAQQRAEGDQLPGAAGGVLRFAGAQELAGDHGAAGGQRRKDVDDEVVDHIHQRDARDGGFAHAGDHDGVRHAHQRGQGLLNDQRPEQPQQVPVGKQRCVAPRRGGLGLYSFLQW